MAPIWLAAAVLAAPIKVLLGLHADGSSGPDPVTDTAVSVGSLSGALSLDTLLPPVHLSASYSPSLRYTDSAGATAVSWLQGIRLAADGESGRLWLGASAGTSFGRQDFSPLAAVLVQQGGTAPPPAIDRLPAARFIDVFSADGQASMRYAVTPRLSAGLAATAGTSGSSGADAAALLPRQRVAGISASASWLASRLDTLGIAASGSYGLTLAPASAPRPAFIFSGSASFTHRLGPATSCTFGAGVGTASTSRGAQSAVLPVGSASLTHAVLIRGQGLSFTAAASAQPAIDALTGVGYVQATGGGSAAWSPAPWLSLGAAVSGARSLSGPFRGRWGTGGELTAAVRVAAEGSFRAGFRETIVPRDFPASTEGVASTRQVSQWSIFAGFSTALRGAL